MSTFVCPPSHRHDKTSTCYCKHGCGCEPCHSARREYLRQRDKQIAYGRWAGRDLVDAEPMRVHVQALVDSDMTISSIARVAGVSMSMISDVLNGKRLRIRRTSAEKVLKVTPWATDAGAMVPAWRAIRRLQALQALGWSLRVVSVESGVAEEPLQLIVRGCREQVKPDVFRRICGAYERMSMTRPPNQSRYERASVSRVVNAARAAGWLPPLAWDDIDDPREIPVGVAA